MKIELVKTTNKELLRNLMNMYQNELSEYMNSFDSVDDNGYFDYHTIDDYYKNDDNIMLYFITLENKYIGFIILTKSPYVYKDCNYCIQEFFIIKCQRNKGIADEVIKMLFSKYEGKYCLTVLEKNTKAITFWNIMCRRYGDNIQESSIEKNDNKMKLVVFDTINMKKLIITDRLILRPISINDVDDAYEWLSDKEVNKFMAYPLYHSIEEAYDWISHLDKSKNDFSFYLKSDNKVIGTGQITMRNGAYELGYNLNKNYWNKGYATEASKAMIKWAYDTENARDFTSGHANANYRSGNVIRKCGFQFSHYGQYSKYDGSQTYEATFYKMHLE